MAEENQTDAAAQGGQGSDGPEFSMQKVFIKDLSFEAPGAPEIFLKEWKGETGIQLNTQARPVGEQEGVYEVELGLTVTTESNGETGYLVEIKQAGVFIVRGFSEEQRNQLLGAYCPNALFPFARETVADLVLKGGFPQLLLQPVNFDALYAKHLKEQQEGSGQGQGGNGAAVTASENP
ncbi:MULTISPECIES: protein-export chaperone SecB [Thioalkalivibrio]|uniref:Protein-export protein SecB n=1 Tax=Thioalkalivibrio halophilus TaxID=252474 RepID=A0A1V2ZXI7_9GAMM|nr:MULTISPECIES: protein-export chaperone SecB [Thioalkalivibrio]OOC09812.1 preprotein translocase subunit SecB [Thioalkalivibrio halophilus]PYG03590.1 protein translocase subunit secB [Thioalkalivibrio sp. ALE21]